MRGLSNGLLVEHGEWERGDDADSAVPKLNR